MDSIVSLRSVGRQWESRTPRSKVTQLDQIQGMHQCTGCSLCARVGLSHRRRLLQWSRTDLHWHLMSLVKKKGDAAIDLDAHHWSQPRGRRGKGIIGVSAHHEGRWNRFLTSTWPSLDPSSSFEEATHISIYGWVLHDRRRNEATW